MDLRFLGLVGLLLTVVAVSGCTRNTFETPPMTTDIFGIGFELSDFDNETRSVELTIKYTPFFNLTHFIIYFGKSGDIKIFDKENPEKVITRWEWNGTLLANDSIQFKFLIKCDTPGNPELIITTEGKFHSNLCPSGCFLEDYTRGLYFHVDDNGVISQSSASWKTCTGTREEVERCMNLGPVSSNITFYNTS
jgi:hypothetical protein